MTTSLALFIVLLTLDAIKLVTSKRRVANVNTIHVSAARISWHGNSAMRKDKSKLTIRSQFSQRFERKKTLIICFVPAKAIPTLFFCSCGCWSFILFLSFFLQAYHTDMYGARYAWLIPGWFSRNWWKIKLENESVACTEDEMNKAVKGYIACDNLKISPDNTVTVSGQVTISHINVLDQFPELPEGCWRASTFSEQFPEDFSFAKVVDVCEYR